VQELAARVGLTFGNASRHVRIFEAGIALETRRDGKRVIDRLAREVEIIGLLRALADNGERNVAEVEHVVASHFRARARWPAFFPSRRSRS
jgi:DNA-binding transcriptional ArsR family regulator